ncbi:hypothetical protein EDD16DRAFT_1517133 [Pisolithus croceorrhizus]|nr:hypothetical protein EDD16DRAFT_1517133 [Pisolithus croceorrhizus]KAI6148266.1 hypothetical protein EDD17DRAFT_1514206 [Pisolithus thermaeus]
MPILLTLLFLLMFLPMHQTLLAPEALFFRSALLEAPPPTYGQKHLTAMESLPIYGQKSTTTMEAPLFWCNLSTSCAGVGPAMTHYPLPVYQGKECNGNGLIKNHPTVYLHCIL